MIPGARNKARGVRAARRRIAYSSEEEEAIPPEYSRRNLKWRERQPLVLKYVDDNLQINRINMETARRVTENSSQFREKHAVQCQNTFRTIVRKVEGIGMKVNGKKMAMICTSGAQSYKARAFFTCSDGETVRSGESMKVLGFHLSSSPMVHAHVDAVCKRLRQK